MLILAQPCEGGPGEFEDTGSMINSGSGPAILLQNGKVLRAGGTSGGEGQLYDPASGTWSATGTVGSRYGHTTTLLSNGDVLVTGGFIPSGIPIEGPNTRDDAELYNPSTGTWAYAGNVDPRGDHTATLLSNGQVLVAGGSFWTMHNVLNPHLNTAKLYDPVSGTWSDTGRLIQERAHHTATLLPDGKVLVAGGYSWNADSTRRSAELYDPATGTWSETGSLTEARYGHTATLLHSGKVLIVGGLVSAPGPDPVVRSAELYDPSTGTWTTVASPAIPRASHTATLLASNKVLVAGGSGTEASATAELYDTATGSWSPAGNLRHPRSGLTATLLPNKKVLLAGGAGDNSAELYTEAPTPPRLLNISTRLRIETGDNAMIGGFIITGTEPKTVIVRGMGPSLDMPGALSDPVIEVHGPAGELLATNDNWRDATTRQEIIDSGLAPTNESESALWGVINPGAYSVVVRGKENTTGIGLFEVYDLDQTVDSQLANVATRGFVQTGDGVLIGGLIMGGGTEGATGTVIIRGLGPSVPAPGSIGDPTLELRDGSGTLIAANDNWKTRPDGSSQQAEIEATNLPPSNDSESALLQTLPAGVYTAILRGKNDTTGMALVEVYNLR